MADRNEAFSRDYYWRRDGMRWIVVTVESDDAGWGAEAILFKAWREKTAANVCGICFESYLEGQRAQRARSSLVTSQHHQENSDDQR